MYAGSWQNRILAETLMCPRAKDKQRMFNHLPGEVRLLNL